MERTRHQRWDLSIRRCMTSVTQFHGPDVLKYISHSVMSNSLQCHGLQSTGLLYPWNSPGKNTGVGCHFLLQGIFLIQGSNPGLLHCRQMLYPRSHKRSPRCLETMSLKKIVSFQLPIGLWITIWSHIKCISSWVHFYMALRKVVILLSFEQTE